jgi:hypothetical protein
MRLRGKVRHSAARNSEAAGENTWLESTWLENTWVENIEVENIEVENTWALSISAARAAEMSGQVAKRLLGPTLRMK